MNVHSDMQTGLARYVLYRAGVWVLLLAALTVLASGCAGAPKPVQIKSEITVAEELNPDYQGRPSPVKIIVFQLSSADAFESADFFSLFEPEASVLGGDMLARTEMLLQPGESRKWEPEFNKETRFVGVVGAFREIENAQWRSTVALPEQGLVGKFFTKNKLKIAVDTLAVNISTE